ncbi:MAG TPA: sigma 54-interacting transcriptional regulator [Vicinamibacterales bacterium]|nr:sigma 54-interacting transcriptional regulator [Vicinamibacterales bacterium]
MTLAQMRCADIRSFPHPPFGATADPQPDQAVIDAARSDRCVLLTGAPAQASAVALRIHNLSGWRWGAFVAVDCGSTEAVIERQLFDLLRAGHRSGTPSQPRPRLTQAGTVFLYEVGKLGLSAQIRLRQVLETSEAQPRSERLRQRVMASTSEALLRRVLDGTFDEELFCRLHAIRLAV